MKIHLPKYQDTLNTCNIGPKRPTETVAKEQLSMLNGDKTKTNHENLLQNMTSL